MRARTVRVAALTSGSSVETRALEHAPGERRDRRLDRRAGAHGPGLRLRHLGDDPDRAEPGQPEQRRSRHHRHAVAGADFPHDARLRRGDRHPRRRPAFALDARDLGGRHAEQAQPLPAPRRPAARRPAARCPSAPAIPPARRATRARRARPAAGPRARCRRSRAPAASRRSPAPAPARRRCVRSSTTSVPGAEKPPASAPSFASTRRTPKLCASRGLIATVPLSAPASA